MGPRMQWDRLKENIAAIVRGSLPRLDYFACYFAKIVAFDKGRQQVDVEPDDARLPTMQGIPFRGPPGAFWDIDPNGGPTVMITWLNGDPARPVAFGFGTGAHVLSLTLNADTLNLGGAAGAERASRGESLNAALDKFLGVLAASCTGVSTLPQVAAAINAIGPAADDLVTALPSTLASNAKVL